MIKELPIIKIGKKKYFIDERLNELRNIHNPHDKESMQDMGEKFWIDMYTRSAE